MFKKILISVLSFFVLSLVLAPSLVMAQGATGTDHFFGSEKDNLAGIADTNLNPREAAVNIINIVLSFLGLVAVVVVLIGGFKWMTAGGNEEKVGSAKKLLISGLIGLIIVLLAWGIATWVIDSVQDNFGEEW